VSFLQTNKQTVTKKQRREIYWQAYFCCENPEIFIEEVDLTEQLLEDMRDIFEKNVRKIYNDPTYTVERPKKPSTPQTGRTYTASEMEDAFFAGERAFRLRNTPDAKYIKFLDWLNKHNLNHRP
jgi:hypothetical protein